MLGSLFGVCFIDLKLVEWSDEVLGVPLLTLTLTVPLPCFHFSLRFKYSLIFRTAAVPLTTTRAMTSSTGRSPPPTLPIRSTLTNCWDIWTALPLPPNDRPGVVGERVLHANQTWSLLVYLWTELEILLFLYNSLIIRYSRAGCSWLRSK